MCWLNAYILINTDTHLLLLEVQEPSVLILNLTLVISLIYLIGT